MKKDHKFSLEGTATMAARGQKYFRSGYRIGYRFELYFSQNYS
jgi:hypothetical protein